MSRVVEKALRIWGLEGAAASLAATRENEVWRIDAPRGAFALRLHRPGYRTDAELGSELAWMAGAGAGGVRVPTPEPAPDGAPLHIIDGVQVDLIRWLDGATLADHIAAAGGAPDPALFHALGAEAALLHDVSDAWAPPPGFTRWSWDRAGLLGAAPLWGRFWEAETLAPEDAALFTRFRDRAGADLAAIEGEMDYGLIHADLMRENVLIDDGAPQLIDFDDSGWGFRLFELATAIVKHLDAPDFDALKAALFAGYRSRRALDLTGFDLMLAIRAATYVGWVADRLDEPGGAARNRRNIDAARMLIGRYLSGG